MNSCLHGSVRYVSYWENPPGQVMPAYVALALVSMRRALGERFLLLTPGTVLDLIDPRILGKAWAFEPLPFTLAKGIEAIVAKSDFIRMAFVHRHGGAWVDADTLFLRDPTSALFPAGLSHKLHWHSECIFASQPGNPCLPGRWLLGWKEVPIAGVILGVSRTSWRNLLTSWCLLPEMSSTPATVHGTTSQAVR